MKFRHSAFPDGEAIWCIVQSPITNNMLVMSRFGGGYFDSSGAPHYYVTDWQGSNIGVVNRDGRLEQYVN